jgi:HEAT repeat protein
MSNDGRDKSQRMRELAGRKDAEAIAELSGLAQDDPSPVVRNQALAALGQVGAKEALAPLTRALADQAPSVRVQALQGIKNLKGAGAIMDLQAMASSDADPTVRKQAVRLLSEMQSPEVPSLLKQAATDNDAAVSEEARQAARRWERRFGAPTGKVL